MARRNGISSPWWFTMSLGCLALALYGCMIVQCLAPRAFNDTPEPWDSWLLPSCIVEVAFVLAVPVTAVMGIRRRLTEERAWRRDRAGCCAACGYDLTGNVSGRCPECGALREEGDKVTR